MAWKLLLSLSVLLFSAAAAAEERDLLPLRQDEMRTLRELIMQRELINMDIKNRCEDVLRRNNIPERCGDVWNISQDGTAVIRLPDPEPGDKPDKSKTK